MSFPDHFCLVLKFFSNFLVIVCMAGWWAADGHPQLDVASRVVLPGCIPRCLGAMMFCLFPGAGRARGLMPRSLLGGLEGGDG